MYCFWPSSCKRFRVRMIAARATIREKTHPAVKPKTNILIISTTKFGLSKTIDANFLILPVENVSLCLSRFALGRKMFIPLVRLAFAKCFMNVASTRSMSRTTYHNKVITKIKTEDLTVILSQLVQKLIKTLTSSELPRYELSTTFM